MRYSISLSYCGEDFCGWQIQPSAPSVQKSVENALSLLLGQPIGITGAGRTDSKVNAVGYIAHFDGPDGLDTEQLICKTNAILPHSIVIHDISLQSDEFHARFSAIQREYTYFIHTKKDPFCEDFSFLCTYPLDFGAMNEAAALLVGRKDFSCFEKTGADNKTSICDIRFAQWVKYTPDHCSILGFQGGEYWYFRICADRFLRNMVRAIVGSLIEVGRGKRDVAWFADLIEHGTRCDAGESVPGHALFLSAVKY